MSLFLFRLVLSLIAQKCMKIDYFSRIKLRTSKQVTEVVPSTELIGQHERDIFGWLSESLMKLVETIEI